MPTDIVDLFQPDRGDLLYGFTGDRDPYFEHMQLNAKPGTPLRKWMDDEQRRTWIVVDKTNNALFDKAMFTSFANSPDDLLNEIESRALNLSNGQQMVRSVDHQQDLANSRFSPAKAMVASAATLSKEADGNTAAEKQYALAIRRACKFGISRILENVKHRAEIHFLIDRFVRNNGERMKQAVGKERITLGGTQNYYTITYSEIRFVFRNWSSLSSRVHFYENHVKVDAPWLDSSRQVTVDGKALTYKQLWATYTQQREQKYAARGVVPT